ncbi:Transposon Tf2-1 polyprotein [Ceratobasidium theobromae]|uniref:Transposon Tf2-1 polyprotein n=1 Tax=Ceratobasidium theobromae TaxID=1582974 RepID=A0A5N5Q7E4_9AGAM|nr:Transposon Tf2-1 polyprotein [Ceratobasidium theobromae]
MATLLVFSVAHTPTFSTPILTTAPVLLLSAISSSHIGHLFIPITLSLDTPINTFAFLDSGMTCSHISKDFIQVHSIPSQHLDDPQIIHMIDGCPLLSGALTHKVSTSLSIANSHFKHLLLGVVSMPYPVLLSLNWLKTHNPTIDWDKGMITLTCCHPDVANTLTIQSLPSSTVKQYVAPTFLAPKVPERSGPCLIIPTSISNGSEEPTVLTEPAVPTNHFASLTGPSLEAPGTTALPCSLDICIIRSACFFKYVWSHESLTGHITFGQTPVIAGISTHTPTHSCDVSLRF